MKTVITLAVAFILGLGVAAGTIGCSPKTESGTKMETKTTTPDGATKTETTETKTETTPPKEEEKK